MQSMNLACFGHISKLMDITAKGFGKPHTSFGVLIHAWMSMTMDLCMSKFFFSDLDVGTCIFYYVPTGTFNITFECTRISTPAQR